MIPISLLGVPLSRSSALWRMAGLSYEEAIHVRLVRVSVRVRVSLSYEKAIHVRLGAVGTLTLT